MTTQVPSPYHLSFQIMAQPQRVLIVGATGFVGSHLRPILEDDGIQLRCGTRHPESAPESGPMTDWRTLDLDSGDGLLDALDGCDAAVYLYHGMDSGDGYAEREARAATRFRNAAADAGLSRIVYLGGVEPEGEVSKHLRSRIDTGRLLREGSVPTVELRAAMVIGEGSISWRIVKDLAERLPAMAIPSWLRNRSMPVLIDDLVIALRAALLMDTDKSLLFDAPGGEVISHRDLLQRVARECGHDPPMIDVPAVFPGLSSLWVGLISDANFHVAKELVEGLRSDLLPTQPRVWERMGGYRPAEVDEAVKTALGDAARCDRGECPDRQMIERILRRGEAATV